MSVAGHHAPFSLYLITDRGIAKSGIIAACEEALAAARVYRKIIAVQLREKDLSGRELLELGHELRRICTSHGAMLLINDRIDVALACDADGVHLPADSFGASDARRLLGPEKLIGASTHSVDEVKKAGDSGADFVVFGPVYRPISKDGYGPAAGLDGLRAACEASTIPVYALGGIDAERVRELHGIDVAGVAVVGSVFGADSPGQATRELLQAMTDQHLG